jgi:tRNA pseudouridine13 synthase
LLFRSQELADFAVDEQLGFEPYGSGEHFFLHIEKRGENTDFVARQLARYAGVPVSSVSYAGMKDRYGVTSQWYSVQIPIKRDIDWDGFNSETVTVRAAIRHNRKLKKGALSGNRFKIVVRGVDADTSALSERIDRIAQAGVPNYFGPQRFGRDGQNLAKAKALFNGEFKPKDRHLAGIYYSAARAYIFNRILARRVEAGTWNQAISGDVYMFSSSHSIFNAELDANIEQRVQAREIHPSGVLWGRGETTAQDRALAIEQAVLDELSVFREGLPAAGLELSRRPLRLTLTDLILECLQPGQIELSFSLPAGAYATAVLQELVALEGNMD